MVAISCNSCNTGPRQYHCAESGAPATSATSRAPRYSSFTSSLHRLQTAASTPRGLRMPFCSGRSCTPARDTFAHCASLCCCPAQRQCCCPARCCDTPARDTHRAAAGPRHPSCLGVVTHLPVTLSRISSWSLSTGDVEPHSTAARDTEGTSRGAWLKASGGGAHVGVVEGDVEPHGVRRTAAEPPVASGDLKAVLREQRVLLRRPLPARVLPRSTLCCASSACFFAALLLHACCCCDPMLSPSCNKGI